MSEDKNDKTDESSSADASSAEEQSQAQSGPQFTASPDPLAGVKKATGDAWKNTEGKTVSMRVYIGSIVGVIILMMLARCGG